MIKRESDSERVKPILLLPHLLDLVDLPGQSTGDLLEVLFLFIEGKLFYILAIPLHKDQVVHHLHPQILYLRLDLFLTKLICTPNTRQL